MPGGAGANTPRNAQTFMVGTSLIVGKTQNNYPAPIAAMSAVYEGCITPIDAGLDIESQYFGTLLAGPVARNMMRSLFINKGAADKLARRPEGIEKSKVSKLGYPRRRHDGRGNRLCFGQGRHGSGIARYQYRQRRARQGLL